MDGRQHMKTSTTNAMQAHWHLCSRLRAQRLQRLERISPQQRLLLIAFSRSSRWRLTVARLEGSRACTNRRWDGMRQLLAFSSRLIGTRACDDHPYVIVVDPRSHFHAALHAAHETSFTFAAVTVLPFVRSFLHCSVARASSLADFILLHPAKVRWCISINLSMNDSRILSMSLFSPFLNSSKGGRLEKAVFAKDSDRVKATKAKPCLLAGLYR